MIFSAIVMLLGGFALAEELLEDAVLVRAPSCRVGAACLSGFADLDVDLSTLKPILKGLAEEGGVDVAVAEEVPPDLFATGSLGKCVPPSIFDAGLLADAPRESPMRMGPDPFL